MQSSKLTEERKHQAVMDVLQGNGSMTEICNRYGISQTYLYKLRDRAISAVSEAVRNKQERPRTREERLENELVKAKQLLGDQAIAIQAFKKKLGLTDT
jgi:transposase-like protein